ncbi:sensor domain-containing diguanylate cyclase [Marinobacterium halophilum]|nr:sensor domain-containing diguanylate cyclase [Marinobacterium halophilum]
MPISTEPSMLPHLQSDSLMHTVINEAPDIILLKDWNGRFLLCNSALARLYGSTPEQMVGKSDADFNPDQDQVRFYQENIQAVMRSGVVQIIEETSTDVATGEPRYFQSIKKPLKRPDGSDCILVIAHDVTELKHAYALLEQKEKRYDYAMEAAGEGIWDWDILNDRVLHNYKWCELLGLDDALTEHPMSALGVLIHPQDRNGMMATVQQALDGDGTYAHEHRMLRTSGEVVWVYDRGRVVEYDEAVQPRRMVGSISDITARKMAERRLEEASQQVTQANEQLEKLVAERTAELAKANRELQILARRDALTGVGNRLQLEEWLFGLSRDRSAVVIMLDIDHFKRINDRYGHKMGDRVLKTVAQCLTEHVRRDDLVARMGGEEFLLVLTGVDMNQALAVVEKLRAHIETLDMLPEADQHITASFGVATLSDNDFDHAMARADEALYEAKHRGRNRVVASPLG